MYMSRDRALLFLLCEVVISLTIQTNLLIISNNFPSLNLYTAQALTSKLVGAVLGALPSRLPASFRDLPEMAYAPIFQQNLAATPASFLKAFQSMRSAHLTGVPGAGQLCPQFPGLSVRRNEAEWHSELLPEFKPSPGSKCCSLPAALPDLW